MTQFCGFFRQTGGVRWLTCGLTRVAQKVRLCTPTARYVRLCTAIPVKSIRIWAIFRENGYKIVQKRNNCAIATVQQVHNRSFSAVGVHNRPFLARPEVDHVDQLASGQLDSRRAGGLPATVERLQRIESISPTDGSTHLKVLDPRYLGIQHSRLRWVHT